MPAKDAAEDYIQWTDENMKARADFFATLNVEKIGDELKSLSAPRLAKQKPKKPVERLEPRKSSRLQEKPCVPLNEKILVEAYQSVSPVYTKRPRRIVEENVDLENCRREDHSSTEDVAVLKDVMTHLGSSGQLHPMFSGSMKNVQASNVVVSKVCKGRPSSLAIHRSTSPLFYAAGDVAGGIGLHCDILSNRYEFEPHGKKAVSGLLFDDCHLLSSSYDGTIRSLDLNRTDAKFKLLYSARDEIGVTYIDGSKDGCYIAEDLWASRVDGSVIRIDNRARNGVAQTFKVSQKHCNTVSTCMEKNLVCTASREETVYLWDARVMPTHISFATKPLGLIKHAGPASSAFLHPTDPYMVLSTSFDNTIRVSRLEGSECKIVRSLRHKNQWTMTPFRAVWHPAGGNLFMVGNLQFPRGIQLFSASDYSFGKLHCSDLLHENFTSVLPLNVFHPTLPLIVGANSSSRCHEIYFKDVEPKWPVLQNLLQGF